MSGNFTNHQIPFEKLPRFEEVSFSPISLRLRTKSLVQLAIFITLVCTGIWYYYSREGFDKISFLILGLIGVFFSIRLIDIFLKQKFYGYAIREKDIVFRSGYISTKTIIIPFNRIQHSAINRTFLDKTFGISTLKIYTAGGSGSDMGIPGLLPDEAIQLNQIISSKVSEHA